MTHELTSVISYAVGVLPALGAAIFQIKKSARGEGFNIHTATKGRQIAVATYTRDQETDDMYVAVPTRSTVHIRTSIKRWLGVLDFMQRGVESPKIHVAEGTNRHDSQIRHSIDDQQIHDLGGGVSVRYLGEAKKDVFTQRPLRDLFEKGL